MAERENEVKGKQDRKAVAQAAEKREALENRMRILDREERRILVSKDELNQRKVALDDRERDHRSAEEAIRSKEAALVAQKESLTRNLTVLQGLAENLAAVAADRRALEARTRAADEDLDRRSAELDALQAEIRRREEAALTRIAEADRKEQEARDSADAVKSREERMKIKDVELDARASKVAEGEALEAKRAKRPALSLSKERLEAIENRIRILDREERRVILAKDELRQRTEAMDRRDGDLRSLEDAIGARAAELSGRERSLDDLMEALRVSLGMSDEEWADDANPKTARLTAAAGRLDERGKRAAEDERSILVGKDSLHRKADEVRAHEADLKSLDETLRAKDEEIKAREALIESQLGQVRLLLPMLARWAVSSQKEEELWFDPAALAKLTKGGEEAIIAAKDAVKKKATAVRRREEFMQDREEEFKLRVNLLDRRVRDLQRAQKEFVEAKRAAEAPPRVAKPAAAAPIKPAPPTPTARKPLPRARPAQR